MDSAVAPCRGRRVRCSGGEPLTLREDVGKIDGISHEPRPKAPSAPRDVYRRAAAPAAGARDRRGVPHVGHEPRGAGEARAYRAQVRLPRGAQQALRILPAMPGRDPVGKGQPPARDRRGDARPGDQGPQGPARAMPQESQERPPRPVGRRSSGRRSAPRVAPGRAGPGRTGLRPIARAPAGHFGL